MSNRILFRPGRWVALIFGGVSAVTVVSFTNAQNTPFQPTHNFTVQPGSAIPVRGTPMQQRPNPNSFAFPDPPALFFGGFPRPVQVMVASLRPTGAAWTLEIVGAIVSTVENDQTRSAASGLPAASFTPPTPPLTVAA